MNGYSPGLIGIGSQSLEMPGSASPFQAPARSLAQKALGFVSNPWVTTGLNVLGLVGKGISWWIQRKEQEKAEKRRAAVNAQQMKAAAERMELERKTYDLNRNTFLERRRNSRLARADEINSRNFERSQAMINNFFGVVNQNEQRRNRFLSLWR